MNNCTIFSICESKRDVYSHPKDYETLAIRLAKSIRRNGGSCSDIPIKMWYGEDAPPSNDSINKLRDLGCGIISGKCLHERYPVYNKITACGMEFDTEYAMWMDSDIYIMSDFSGLLETKKDVLVSPDQRAAHRWSRSDEDKDWNIIYKTLEVDKPTQKIKCHIDGGMGNFYFCSGMFAFKTNIGFSDVYRKTTNKIIELGGLFTENFTQTGLGMAVHVGRYDYDLIPEKYHYMYSPNNKKLAVDTVIVHYQGERVTEIGGSDWDVNNI